MQYFTADTHKITVTEAYYCGFGHIPEQYHLEDGRELVMAQIQTVNCTDANGNGGHNPIRFVLKEQAQ